MKPSINRLHTAKSHSDGSTKKTVACKSVKLTIVIFMFTCISLLSSCAIMIGTPSTAGYGHNDYRGSGCVGCMPMFFVHHGHGHGHFHDHR